jgi:hypothetical protein
MIHRVEVRNERTSLNSGLSPLRIGRLRPRSGPLDRIFGGPYIQILFLKLVHSDKNQLIRE